MRKPGKLRVENVLAQLNNPCDQLTISHITFIHFREHSENVVISDYDRLWAFLYHKLSKEPFSPFSATQSSTHITCMAYICLSDTIFRSNRSS